MPTWSTRRPDVERADFASFVTRHQGDVLKFAMVLCGNATRAEDLVADALGSAFERWPRIGAVENPVRAADGAHGERPHVGSGGGGGCGADRAARWGSRSRPRPSTYRACGIAWSRSTITRPLEHGGIWITYNPKTITQRDLDTLKNVVNGVNYLFLPG